MLIAIALASGHHESSITLTYTSTTSITINYVIYSSEELSNLKSKIDGSSFKDTLNTKFKEQSIKIGSKDFVIDGAANHVYTDISGKNWIHVTHF